MKSVKTARGRTIDMATLAAKNEETRAVSNLNMNARGDIIDNRGNVEISRETIAKKFYKDNVPGADAETISIKAEESPAEAKKPVDTPKPAPKKETTPVPKVSKTPPKVTEVSRTARTRDDGTQYFEVEYSDGSMEDVDQK